MFAEGDKLPARFYAKPDLYLCFATKSNARSGDLSYRKFLRANQTAYQDNRKGQLLGIRSILASLPGKIAVQD